MRIALIIVSALFALALGFATTVWWNVSRAPAAGRGEVVRLTVPRGEPFSLLARRLEGAGLVRSARPLGVYAALMRSDRRIHSGTYEFTIGERPVDILQRLARGDVLQVSVTVPEGFTMWDISGVFQTVGIDSLDMLAAITAPDTRMQREIPTASLEGYLFPDTYLVPWGASAQDIVTQMLARTDETFVGYLERCAELDWTPHQVLTMASIIEAEARVSDERPLISAVYHNRLRRGMRLEADPTVAYAMGGYRGRLLYRDLEIDSPYNTYRNRGLPPGPICSPGDASIRAALYPDADTDALYFVARGDGSHVFSRTLREHENAVRESRRERAADGNR